MSNFPNDNEIKLSSRPGNNLLTGVFQYLWTALYLVYMHIAYFLHW